MTKMNKEYRDIRTMDELTEAIHRSHARIEAKGESVRRSFSDVQEFYAPQNLALQGIRRVALSVDFYRRALNIIQFLKKRLEK